MNLALWLSFVVACCASLVVWLSNLKVSSSADDPLEGALWLRWTWGIFLTLVLVKLMILGAR